MLKRKYRSLKADDVTQLFEGSHQTISNSSFRLLWDLSNHDYSQVVVVIPRKLGLNAVQRNRLKRQVLSLLSQNLSDWTGGIRLAILVKTSALVRSRQQFQRDLLSLLSQANLLT